MAISRMRKQSTNSGERMSDARKQKLRGIAALLSLALTTSAGSAAAQDVDRYSHEFSIEAKPTNAPMSITDAIAVTVVRHPQIAQALALVARGRADVDAARSVWYPVLAYRGNLGPDKTSSSGDWELNNGPTGGGIVLEQLIWDFGRSRGQIDAASAVERQRQLELEATADQLAEQAALAFLDVKHYELLQGEAERHIASLERLRELIRLRSDAGLSDKSDLLLAGVRVESARGEQVQIRTGYESAVQALANLTGLVADRYLDPAGIVTRLQTRQGEPDLNALPLIAAAEAAERAAEARIGEARASRWPRLGLQVGYDRYHYSGFDSTVRPNDSVTALITVTGDVYRAGNRHAVRAAIEDRRAARAVRDAVALDLRGRILAAREQIAGGEARIEAHRNQERHAIRTSQIFLEEYKLGKRSLADLLSAELEIYRAASARIGAEYDVMRARIRHEAAYGSLRQSLGLAMQLTDEDVSR
jgi:adhesin transport system outer membrane protein